MIKKQAFTLIEIMIVILIIAVISITMLMTLKYYNYAEKENYAKVLKTLEFIEVAFSQVMEAEKEQCPTGALMVKPVGAEDWILSILDESGKEAEEEDIVKLLGKYLKYDTEVIEFCDYTGYCGDSTTIGAGVPGGIYFGIKKRASIGKCATYNMPNEEAELEAPTKYNDEEDEFEIKRCWGRLYIDVNGLTKPNKLGEDVYIFGLGQYGIEK